MVELVVMKSTPEEIKAASRAEDIMENLLVKYRQDLHMNSGSMNQDERKKLEEQTKELQEDIKRLPDRAAVKKGLEQYGSTLRERYGNRPSRDF